MSFLSELIDSLILRLGSNYFCHSIKLHQGVSHIVSRLSWEEGVILLPVPIERWCPRTTTVHHGVFLRRYWTRAFSQLAHFDEKLPKMMETLCHLFHLHFLLDYLNLKFLHPVIDFLEKLLSLLWVHRAIILAIKNSILL